MGEIILGVNVSENVIRTWLEVHTATAAAESFEVDGGTLTLEPLTELDLLIAFRGPIRMWGQFRAPGKTRARRVSDVLTLRITPLGWGTEVRIDPTWPAVAPYAVALVGAIAHRWPTRVLNPSASAPAVKSENEPRAVSDSAPGDTSQHTPAGRPDGPRVPTRPKDRVRWQATWQKVKGQWQQGKGYTEMSDWLAKAHPELRCSAATLADLIQAGHAGLLDGRD